MRFAAAAVALGALASSAPGALAWGAAGHEIVASIAQMHLMPGVMPVVCSVLFPNADSSSTPCTLASVATWADRNRMHMRWSAALHYVGGLDDHPPNRCAFPGRRGWAGKEDINVLHGIRNVTGILDDFVDHAVAAGAGAGRAKSAVSASELARAGEALRFLVHFVGDMHQPLHLTGRDRGGNGAQVAWNGRHTNLHSLWDGLLIAKALRTIPRNYTRPLPVPPLEAVLTGTIYDPYVRRIMWDGVGLGAYSDVPGRWSDEVESWLECPPAAAPSFVRRAAQAVLSIGLGKQVWTASETDDARICPHAWAAPIHALNCDLVWPPAFDDTHDHERDHGSPPPSSSAAPVPPSPSPSSIDADAIEGGYGHAHLHTRDGRTPDAEDELRAAMMAYGRRGRNEGGLPELDVPAYAGVIDDGWVVERLLAQAGVRLAGVLNAIFEPLAAERRR